jgi:hypothetical protein
MGQSLSVYPELESALVPVLRDLEATTDLGYVIGESQWSGVEGQQTAVISGRHGGQGIFVRAGEIAVAQVAGLADQIQEWAVEQLWYEGRPATWPECPSHPDSHPLEPVVQGGSAVWRCPVSLAVVSVVGSLTKPG